MLANQNNHKRSRYIAVDRRYRPHGLSTLALNRFTKLSLLLTFLYFLVGCGGEGENGPDNPNDPTTKPPTTTPPSTTTPVQGNADNGQTLFAQQCATCHKPEEEKMVEGHDLASLQNIIDTGMPLNDASLCDTHCANDVAAYIAATNPFFGKGNTGSPSGSNFGEVRIPVGNIDPAPIGVRRLNRAEYNNTVRDLLYTDLRPADSFPDDDFGHGFNNIADMLSISLAHVEQYDKAADALVAEALQTHFGATGSLSIEAESLSGTDITIRATDVRMGRSSSTLNLAYNASVSGIHQLTIFAGEDQAGGVDSNMRVSVNGQVVDNIGVSAPANVPAAYSLQLQMPAGNNQIDIRFTNDFYSQGEYDRNLYIDKLIIASPATSENAKSIFNCDISAGESCARTTAEQFGKRAWRRNLSNAEVDGLLATYRAGRAVNNNTKDAMSVMLKAILLSPKFLFRYEPDVDLQNTDATPLTAHQLATRLSYFLWGSMPDDALFKAADNGSLLQEATLREQVRRMLAAPKSESLVHNFAAQWLQYDKVLESSPDSTLFANFDASLVAAMRKESSLFVLDWLKNNGKLSELLTANHTFLNARLASHYGVPGFNGETFERHEWQGNQQRPGVMGHASILTMTSHPDSTAPVLRGKWVLDQLICREPPPPPPTVEGIGDLPNIENLTTRQIFELHRDASTVCYSCHVLMDPIGFGLENFDAIGRWREKEDDKAVDSSGELPGGFKFSGPQQLAEVLAESAELPLCATKNLLTYALGRRIDALHANSNEEGLDDPLVYQIYSNTLANGNRINDIIEEIVVSDAFRTRRGAESQVGGAQ